MTNKQLSIVLLLFSISSIVISSCDDWKPNIIEKDAIRRIANTTDYYLSVKVYGDIDTLKYEISPNSTFDIEGKCYEGGGDEYCEIGWMSMAYGSITFDNERIQSFELNNPLGCNTKAINGDVWEGCGYKLVENTETLQVFEYQVTDTDYHNAEIL